MTHGISLTKLKTDNSDKKSFSFSFFCDCCWKSWKSPSTPYLSGGFASIKHEETRKLIWIWEHEAAFEYANTEAHLHFKNCSECGKWVCDECFDVNEQKNYGLCRECSENPNLRTKNTPSAYIQEKAG